jgi:hypothetical protein
MRAGKRLFLFALFAAFAALTNGHSTPIRYGMPIYASDHVYEPFYFF